MTPMSAIGDTSLVEPEQDANTVLTELDKGLRSGKIGEQCEAIVKFPRLFEKYPFPILINSSLLKLADVFRVGSNFLRVWVLRVCQQNEKHLDKIINVDEFVRRIFSVFHSNDPVARALTLRTLGAVAGIIPERQQVHHGIRSSLDSHDAVEVEAAIFAATQFAAQSKKFAVSMCNKVSEMIQGLATPSHRKLQLIPILQHMHHDTSTASMVRSLCKRLLSGYPAEDFVLVTLSTLTQLAVATLVDIPQQVTLLVGYLQDDPRWTVKAGALEGLCRLAQEGAHLWPNNAVTEVVQVALSTDKTRLLSSALDVLSILAKSAQTCHNQITSGAPLLVLARKCALSANTRIAAKGISILASVLCYSYEEKLDDALNDGSTIGAIESLFILSSCEPVKLYELKTCLQAMVKICKTCPSLSKECVPIIATRLFHSDCCNILLCEALAAIGGTQISTLQSILPDIIDKLRRLSRVTEPTDEHLQTQVILCTLLFQSQMGYSWNPEVRHAVIVATSSNNDWANFRIARSAARYGHHEISREVFGKLKNRVSSEHFHFWLNSLEELSHGEAALLGDEGIITRISTALTHYCKAHASLKGASTMAHPLQFQAEYVKIRCEFLQCLVQLVHACNSMCTSPHPVISTQIPLHSRDELQRFGQVTTQLQKCVKEFRSCGEMYQKLYQSAFDADPESLANIQMYQQLCLLVAATAEKVCYMGPFEEFTLDISPDEYGLEIRYLAERCRLATTLVDPIINNKDRKPITHQHTSALVHQVQIIAETAYCLPRFFFQTLQSTRVKLNISPQPRVAGESISVQGGSQLAVKVEGVIVHGSKPGLFRQAANIVVSLQTQLQARQHSQPDTKAVDVGSTVTQSVVPHRDFFTAQFLLAFVGGGQYALTIEAAIADENGHIWRTGPRGSLGVKYHEESSKASAVLSGSRSFPAPRQFL